MDPMGKYISENDENFTQMILNMSLLNPKKMSKNSCSGWWVDLKMHLSSIILLLPVSFGSFLAPTN